MSNLHDEFEAECSHRSGRSRAQAGRVQAKGIAPGSIPWEGRLDSSAASRCLKRIRKWRVPPRWSRREWLEEVEAEATVATLQALRDFDPVRGVPWNAFLYHRILHAVLAGYRREWAYAIHRVTAGTLDEYEALESSDSALKEIIAKLLEKALGQLSDSDISLIEELFWGGKSEANLAEYLGISQQAVNKRKRTIFRNLRRGIENLGKVEDSWL